MSKIEKLINQFNSKPVPNDITFNEAETLFTHFGCIIESGANHTKIVHPASGTVIPIPRHGKTIPEVYIKQLKGLLELLGDD